MSEETKQDSVGIDEELAKVVLEVLFNQNIPIPLEKINELKSDSTLNITSKDLFWLSFTNVELIQNVEVAGYSEDGTLYQITDKGKLWFKNNEPVSNRNIRIEVLKILASQKDYISIENLQEILNQPLDYGIYTFNLNSINESFISHKFLNGDYVYGISDLGKKYLGETLYSSDWGKDYGITERIEKLDELLGITIQDKVKGIQCFYDGHEFGGLCFPKDKPVEYIVDSLWRNGFFQHHDRNGRTCDSITLRGYKFLEDNKPDLNSNWGEQGYLNLLRKILYKGQYRKPENEEGRNELFLEVLRYDLTDYKLPLFTSKFVFVKGAAREMEWFLTGDQDTSYLDKHKVSIWDEWKNKDDVVGPLYGFQWRHWQIDPNVRFAYKDGSVEIDQISDVINSLRDRPEARSHMVTAWRPDHLKLMSIKPCHILLQFYRIGNVIDLAMYQRSH